MNPAASSRKVPSPAAFTLIELLLVVAIIAILALIAVPNFLEAQTRAKVSRIKNDMRSLTVGIESYYTDNNAYPVRRNVLDAALMPAVPELGNRLSQMSVLTTPIAYITSLPIDVFERILPPPNILIDYYDPVQTTWLINSRFPLNSNRRLTPEEARYVLVSVGPDGFLGPVNSLYGWPLPVDPSLVYLGNIYVMYDPTNGTTSKGNIYGGARGVEGTPAFLLDRFDL